MSTGGQGAGVPLHWRLAATVVLPFGIGYFLANLTRTLNAVIAPHIARELSLSAVELGFTTGVYFVVFAAAQLPIGIVLDRYGPRRVASTLLMVGAVGMLLFAAASGVAELTIARAVIGLGVSACLMAALKANNTTWPAHRLPLVNGVTGAMGMLGSIGSTLPIEALLPVLGWRGVMVMLALATAAVAATTLALAAEPTWKPAAPFELRQELGEILRIARDPVFLVPAVPVTLHTGTYLAYQSLWAGPWLRDVAGLDSAQVALALFAFNCGMLLGTLGSGWVAGRLATIGVTTTASLQIGMLLSLLSQLMFVAGMTRFPVAMCLVFGLTCSTWFLVYSVLGQHFARTRMGRVNTLLNTMIFVAAFLAQWGAGLIINAWPMPSSDRFSASGHACAFGTLLALEVAAFAWWLRRHHRAHRSSPA
jgi:MFS family permease